MSAIASDCSPEQRVRVRRGRVGEVSAELRVLMVAGIGTGVLVVGVGSRLAMFVLRLTSPDRVRGVTSDDGFTIGRFTLSGTYNLLMLGAAVGVIGAAVYQWVRPWLLGPRWFRLVTVALSSGAVVGPMLVHADGIDFTVLEPMWLAVGLFVALPALFAVCIAFAVDRLDASDEHPGPMTWRRWILPAVLAAAFPPVLALLAIAVVVLLIWVNLRDRTIVRRVVDSTSIGIVARLGWLAVALLGRVALVGAGVRAIA
jgi:hypothetical protein